MIEHTLSPFIKINEVMTLRIKDILLLQEFQYAKIISGKSLLATEVNGATIVNTLEGCASVERGNFILTTGFPSFTDEAFKQFIRSLAEKGVSGLGIKIGSNIPSISSDIQSFAEHYKLVIIELDSNIPWADLMIPIVNYINYEQKLELEKIKNIYEAFQAFLLAKSDIQQLPLLMEKLLAKKTTIYLHAIDKSYSSFALPPVFENVLSNIVQTMKTQNLTKESFQELPISVYVKPIYENRHLEGCIIIWECQTLCASWHNVAISQATAILLTELQKIKSIISLSQQNRSSFLLDVFRGKFNSTEEIVRVSKEVNWNLADHPYQLLLLELTFPDDQKQDAFIVTSQLIFLLEKYTLTKICFDSNNYLVLLLDTTSEITADFICKKIDFLLAKYQLQVTYFGGVGRVYTLSAIVKSYNEALISLHFAKTKKNLLAKVIHFEHLNFERILFSNHPIKEASFLQQEYLLPLKEFDQKKAAELYHTLKVFLFNNADFNKTAEQLFVHKNTVRYRLSLIKEISKLNPEKLQDQILFYIGFLLEEIQLPAFQ
ncbi:PucR family transcriptional regulator ligand-binding domain-containing protein [Lysinibacillus sp. FSL K6-0232]|uniref:PucR family transcriptional regulator n=1 Tax=Lysinibacillus sp. FSL K6-0232 TaxID=2921425 RepID=UPI0030F5835F